ncbi:SET domain-containing protein [Trametes versicolor FP-101664 SS1]|uniref:SET domain-containing protein n=1 Tax=Trametes versicolor (strain FP-101664) TaxID=717944 RepID=UPI0004621A5E|nr:SET domain-containing protein [Trametes versicolor FP-101664 SS1]EIW59441.1 SET domain-containing protein [Trametes versicolor FP-101664 SS1]
MVLSEVLPPQVRLASHATARNAAVATSALPSGSVIATIPGLATCLLPSEKGKRCDACHILQSDAVTLKRCSGCASFWYCGTLCQMGAWKAHHKKLCKNFNTLTTSNEYQALTPHDQVDALLLSQMIADSASWRAGQSTSGPHATFLDLLKGPRADVFELPLCLPKGALPSESLSLAKELYGRFGNNNFALHSHLNAYAHGVFPLASRLFNHSCIPNAACKYIIRASEPVAMQVVALRDIAEGEEITIPYLDPALPYQTRQEALEVNYSFNCDCRLCRFQSGIHPVNAPPERGSDALRALEVALRTFALGADAQSMRVPTAPGTFESMPTTLHPVFHETYLPALSEVFSKTSHEGPYVDAVEAGLTLLALYVVVYPPQYPQIGMHALELSKTIWNVICSAGPDMPARESEVLEAQTRRFLQIAASVLQNFGPEGDAGGPLEEIHVLRDALTSE